MTGCGTVMKDFFLYRITDVIRGVGGRDFLLCSITDVLPGTPAVTQESNAMRNAKAPMARRSISSRPRPKGMDGIAGPFGLGLV
jgi:hypothetical protein